MAEVNLNLRYCPSGARHSIADFVALAYLVRESLPFARHSIAGFVALAYLVRESLPHARHSIAGYAALAYLAKSVDPSLSGLRIVRGC